MSQNFERFGKYILLEKLASGGMAEVYLSKSNGAEGVNKFVAIKRILPQYSENPEFVEMFKEEAKIAVNLTHSNIVSIFDFGVERNQFYLVMDYLEGKNLRQITTELKKQNKALTIEQIVYILKEAAAGLDHAHRGVDSSTGKPLNVIHRDVSPQNLMISYDGEVKVIDFGIAKAETQIEATKAGTLKGKYGYMSPEQADGQSIDSSTDIFSLGIVLWELLANDRLFTASSEAAILRKIRECQIPPIKKLNPSVPAELEKIVHKALAKDKSLRYQTTASFHRDLNRFLNTAYPEFSPHDFAVFMKETFSSEFLEIQKKRVEYSKVKAQDNPEIEKTLIGNTRTQIPTPPKAPIDRTVIDSDPDDGEVLKIDTSASIKVDLGAIKQGQETGVSGSIRNKTQLTRFGTQVGNHPNHGRTSTSIQHTRAGGTSIQSQKQKTSWLVPLALSLFFISAGLLAWNKGYLNLGIHKTAQSAVETRSPRSQIENPANISSVSTPLPKEEATPTVNGPNPLPPEVHSYEAASNAPTPQMVALTIYAENPPVDRIFIDGQDFGISPVRTSVPSGRQVKIRLEKEGFQPFETTQVFNEAANTRHFKMPAENEMIAVRIRPAVKLAGTNLILINGQVPTKKDEQVYLVKLGKNQIEISDGFAIYGNQEIFVQKKENSFFEIKVQGGNLEGIERLKRAYSK